MPTSVHVSEGSHVHASAPSHPKAEAKPKSDASKASLSDDALETGAPKSSKLYSAEDFKNLKNGKKFDSSSIARQKAASEHANKRAMDIDGDVKTLQSEISDPQISAADKAAKEKKLSSKMHALGVARTEASREVAMLEAMNGHASLGAIIGRNSNAIGIGTGIAGVGMMLPMMLPMLKGSGGGGEAAGAASTAESAAPPSDYAAYSAAQTSGLY